MPTTQFLNYLKTERRYSLHTLTAYESDLQQLALFLSENFDENIKNATSTMLRSWIVSLIETGMEPKSINRKISSAKSFFNFLLKKQEITILPTARLISPKVKKLLPKFVKEPEMESLMESIPFENDFQGRRDRLLIEILYACGLRLSELIGIKDADVDMAVGTMKVLGKRNKERIVPMHLELQKSISRYLEVRAENGFSDSGRLLLTDKGEKLYPKFVYRKVNYYLGQVTTIEQRSPHLLRHTFATHMLNNGADLNTIKEILGHANLSATQIYTHNSMDKLKKIYNQAHPRA